MAAWLENVRNRWQGSYRRWRYSWDGRAPATFVVVAVLLGLLLGLGLGRWWLYQDSPTASAPERAQLSRGTDSRQGTQDVRAAGDREETDPLASCREVYAAQRRPLATIGPAMSQWEVHIGAMNKLVVGAITLAQATDFWNRTREGAAAKLGRFADAQRAYEQRTTRCPEPVGQASKALRSCATAVAARQDELGRAAVALGTWRTHVRHMEMLRRGEMTPEDATRMWLASWHEGTRQVDAFRSAARDAERVAGSEHAHHGSAGRPCAG